MQKNETFRYVDIADYFYGDKVYIDFIKEEAAYPTVIVTDSSDEIPIEKISGILAPLGFQEIHYTVSYQLEDEQSESDFAFIKGDKDKIAEFLVSMWEEEIAHSACGCYSFESDSEELNRYIVFHIRELRDRTTLSDLRDDLCDEGEGFLDDY